MDTRISEIKWTDNFSWDRGKAICTSNNMTLLWEASDPWRLWIRGEEITDFPYFHAEDCGLAKKYAEKTYKKLYIR